MALLRVTFPKALSFTQQIEYYMHCVYHVRKLPLRRYLTEEQLRSMFPRRNIVQFLIRSREVFGFIHPDTKRIYVHPDGAFKAFRKTNGLLRKLKI